MALVRTAADIVANASDQQAEVPTILRWENPPARDPRGNHNPQQGLGRYTPLLTALSLRPGRWALVYIGDMVRAKTVANAIRANRDYEAVNRRVNGCSHTYARYMGEG